MESENGDGRTGPAATFFPSFTIFAHSFRLIVLNSEVVLESCTGTRTSPNVEQPFVNGIP
jgi:hypothetical protein